MGSGVQGGVGAGLVDDLGEQFGGHPVRPRGQTHLVVDVGTAVQLGGPTGAGPRPIGEPPERRHEQARVDELVEVEGSERALDPDRLGRLVAADITVLADNVPVERAPDRFLQCGDRL